jgi:hypothetical protein
VFPGVARWLHNASTFFMAFGLVSGTYLCSATVSERNLSAKNVTDASLAKMQRNSRALSDVDLVRREFAFLVTNFDDLGQISWFENARVALSCPRATSGPMKTSLGLVTTAAKNRQGMNAVNGPLHAEAATCMLPVGWEMKTEIPDRPPVRAWQAVGQSCGSLARGWREC